MDEIQINKRTSEIMQTLFVFGITCTFCLIIWKLLSSIIATEFLIPRPSLLAIGRDLSKLSSLFNIVDYAQKQKGTSDIIDYYSSTTFRDYKLLKWVYGTDRMHTVLRHGSGISPNIQATALLPLMAIIAQFPPSDNIDNTDNIIIMPKPRKNTKKRHHAFSKNTNTNSDSSDDNSVVWRSLTKKHENDPHLKLNPRNIDILEVGFGKGENSLVLADLFKNVHICGIDINPDHQLYASNRAAALGLQNRVKFLLGDATNPPEVVWYKPFDIIFGIETFCQFDDEKKRDDILLVCRTMLKHGGALVIVDGYRADTFMSGGTSDALPCTAMRLAEAGFQINAMPSRLQWKHACARAGLKLVEETDLTDRAHEFWSKWGKLSRLVLHSLPSVALKLIQTLFPMSFNNFVAVCMASHAMCHGSASYGILVFKKT